ncbi:MAG: DUF805 domain-containing protein [Bacteroidota bacterium]
MKWYFKVLMDYATFTGRSRRKEYWTFALLNYLILIILAVADNIIDTTFKLETLSETINLPYGYIFLTYNLAVLIPSIAVTVRRLHDVGKSGWFLLIGLIPFIGAIWLLILFFTDSQYGENKYGQNSKENSHEILENTTLISKSESENIKSQQEKINELQQLKQLLDSGVLNEIEFNEQKFKILN